MKTLTSSLIVRLINDVSGPARAVQKSLLGIRRTTENGSRLTFGQGLNRAIRQNEASLDRARGGMVDAVAGFYALKTAIGAPINAAIGFEAAMSKVGAVSRASDTQLSLLTSTARKLGAETAWSASQAAQGMEFLSMAGFSVNDVVAAMPGMLDLASASGADLGRTADIASNILSGFAIEAGEMGRVGDVLTNTFTSSNTNLEMLGNTMSYVAPVAAAVGASIETTAAMAGKLGDAGIQGSQAGTALRAMFTRLSAPPRKAAKAIENLRLEMQDANGVLRDTPDILSEVNSAMGGSEEAEKVIRSLGVEIRDANGDLRDMPTILAEMNEAMSGIEEAEKAVSSLGIQTKDANGNLRDVPTILAEMNAAMEGMGTAAKTETLAHVFGMEAASAATVLLGQAGSGALQEYTKSLHEMGSASRVAMKMNDNTAGALKRLNSATESLSISVGNALIPGFTALVEKLIPVVGWIDKFSTENPVLVSSIVQVATALIGFKVAMAGLKFVGLLGRGGALSMLSLGFNTVGRASIGAIAAARNAIALQTALGAMSGQRIGLLGKIATGMGGIARAIPGVARVERTLGAISRFTWRNALTPLRWAQFIPRMAWSGFTSALRWGALVPRLSWARFLSPLRWASFLPRLGWGSAVSAMRWGAYIPRLRWLSFLSPLRWLSFIPSISWRNLAGRLSWRALLTPLKWGSRLIPGIGWAVLAGELLWNFLIKPLGWDEYLPKIDWGAIVGAFSWDGWLPEVDWSAFTGAFSWPAIPEFSWPDFPKLSLPDLGLVSWARDAWNSFEWPSWPSMLSITFPSLNLARWAASAFEGFEWPGLPAFEWPSFPKLQMPSLNLSGWASGEWGALSWPSWPILLSPSLPALKLLEWAQKAFSAFLWPNLPVFSWPEWPALDLPKLFGHGKEMLSDLLAGAKSGIASMLEWVRSIPSMIIEAIGSINLSDIIKWPEPPNWWKVLTGSDKIPDDFTVLPEQQQEAVQTLQDADNDSALPTAERLADLDASIAARMAAITALEADLAAKPMSENTFGSAFDSRDNDLEWEKEKLAELTADQEYATARANELRAAIQAAGETEVNPEINRESIDTALAHARQLSAEIRGLSGGPVKTEAAVPLDGKRRSGGPVRRGGRYLVGEDGPEVVEFGQDGFVHNARETAAMLRGISGQVTGAFRGARRSLGDASGGITQQVMSAGADGAATAPERPEGLSGVAQAVRDGFTALQAAAAPVTPRAAAPAQAQGNRPVHLTIERIEIGLAQDIPGLVSDLRRELEQALSQTMRGAHFDGIT